MGEVFKQLDSIARGITQTADKGSFVAVMVIVFGVVAILLMLLRERGHSKSEVKSLGVLLERVAHLEESLGALRGELHETLERFNDVASDVRDGSSRSKKGPGGEGNGGAQGSGGGGFGGPGGRGGSLGTAAPVDSAEACSRLARGLGKTRASFVERIRGLFKAAPRIDQKTLDELEELLISSDVGTRCAASLVDQVKQAAQGAENLSESRVKALLKAGLRDALIEVSPSHRIYKPAQSPLVILVVGVNGVGKTTTVAKLAARYHEQGKKVVLVAADTFRAAAVQQLLEWGRRLDVQVVSGSENAKPGTVVFDGMVAAQESSADVVLIDTAGRLHTKANLMQELEGIRNAIRKHVPDAPHETVLVLDGVSGQNALAQAREFNDAVELTGLVITKLDGTPRGGIVVAISRELEIPVFYVGVGERAEDLVPFSREEFTDGLLGDDGAGYGEGVGSYTNDLPISHESAQKENGSFTTH